MAKEKEITTDKKLHPRDRAKDVIKRRKDLAKKSKK